ncbi:MAG: hypothetical protein ACYC64_00365 [Armatimonadota bacterium]
MKKIAVVLAIVALAICAATAVYGDSINLSESWYIKITNFSLRGEANFNQFWTYGRSTTSLIEPKLQDTDPNNQGFFRTLLFDFHAGQANADDISQFEPYATLGSDWSGTMSFNWAVYCNDPRVLFDVYSPWVIGGEYPTVWWSAPTGNSSRSGTASFYVSTLNQITPAFRVSFASVPEPSTFVVLLCALFCVPLLNRRARAC